MEQFINGFIIKTNIYRIQANDSIMCGYFFEIKDYFVAEVKERKLINKSLSKYICPFDYFDKFLIVFSATNDSISIASFATVTGEPVRIANASFSLAFSVSTGIVK